MSSETERSHGTVKRIVADKGFLFLSQAQGADVFVHRSDSDEGVFDSLQVGDPVTFVLQQSVKGLRGVAVRKL